MADVYTLTFDANGGTGGPSPITMAAGSSGTTVIPNTNPTRPGCTFLGWDTKRNGTGTHYDGGDTVNVVSVPTLYAMWVGCQITSLTAYRSTSGGAKSATGTYGHVVAKTKCISSLAGSASATAKWGSAGSTPTTSVTLSNATYSKTANTDATRTHEATFGGSFPVANSYVVQVTITLSCTYNGATRTATQTVSTIVPKATVTFSALAGGNGIGIGVTATVSNALEVGWKCIQSATNLGWWLVDRLGQRYAAANDNGTNFWLGASTSLGDHHMGYTYLSAGYDYSSYLEEQGDWKANGNQTAYISVPSRAGAGSISHQAYGIYHSGYLDVGHATAGVLPIANGGTGTASFGTIVQSDVSTDVSVASGTTTELGRITLTAGTWLIRYAVLFPANATGRRQACISTTSGSVSDAWLRYCGSAARAVSGGRTALNGCYVRVVTANGDKTFYLNVLQDSGSTLNVVGNLQAIRIC